jgi:glutathione-regulated potassium-efflux system ancillary protein KefF
MKKILVISGHPELSGSTANRLIIEKLSRFSLITVKDIKENYPDGRIDVEKEQDDLQNADLIILQFPFIWYGMPSHLKGWIEQVFAMGFAFGKGGDKLKHKKLMLSITLGGSEKDYSRNGRHQYNITTFLRPLQLFIKYCGMEYLPPVISYSMSAGSANSVVMVRKNAESHVRKLLSEIKKIRVEPEIIFEEHKL